MEQMMNYIRYPTVAQGFINRDTIKAAIQKQILEGLQICQARDINIINKQRKKEFQTPRSGQLKI
jgi:hypothetical protein